MLTTSTLRPGLLVSLSTQVVGNVHYRTTTIEPERLTEDGGLAGSWKTDKTIADAQEHSIGIETRAAALAMVRGPCARTPFGLLCPEDKRDLLDASISEAQRRVDRFNETAKMTRIKLYVMVGKIAQDDVEAAQKITGEVGELLAAMAAGAENLDVETIRSAANAATSIGRMLSAELQERLSKTVAAARKTARQIVKAGDSTEVVKIDTALIRELTETRAAFLDLEEPDEIAAPVTSGRALDLTPLETAIAAAGSARQIEL